MFAHGLPIGVPALSSGPTVFPATTLTFGVAPRMLFRMMTLFALSTLIADVPARLGIASRPR